MNTPLRKFSPKPNGQHFYDASGDGMTCSGTERLLQTILWEEILI